MIYHPYQLKQFIEGVNLETIKNPKTKKEYYNIEAAFDIETSSFYQNDEKVAIMYEWTLGISDRVMIGRNWFDFEQTMKAISEILGLYSDKILIIYVHNFEYEFQFIRKHFEWDKIFALNSRRIVYGICTLGIEFRCSYTLTGYSLEKVGEHLHKHKIEKLVGNLDYSLIRHSGTPLTEKEIAYCVHDVLIILYHIRECIDSEGDITKIPLTKTGYVRNACRNACMKTGENKYKKADKFKEYRRLMDYLVLDPQTYVMCKSVFAGGFTHANAFYSRKVMENVWSFDYSSAYPYVMVAEQFPMSPPKRKIIKNQEEFVQLLKTKCCMFKIEFTNIRPKVFFEHYISESKCHILENACVDNGRVVSADKLVTIVTEQDYLIINKFYEWDSKRIADFTYFEKGYLPTDYVKTILDFYEKKTSLKGVDGQEVEYMKNKENVNSLFGMMVTDICRPEIIYENDEWREEIPDLEETIKKNNESKKRFLYYPWGIWVTAYNRRNLFSGIYEFGEDYVYSDTDSIKGMNYEKHQHYIDTYNKMVKMKLQESMKFHKIPLERVHPKTIKGEEKWLGVWENEGCYTRFKTIGAKRYMVEQNGKISITVSGLNKKTAVPYLIKTYGDEIWSAFDDEMEIPATSSGKMTHTYIDVDRDGYVTDYLGNREYYHEMSAVHLENAPFSMKLSDSYAEFLLMIEAIPM